MREMKESGVEWIGEIPEDWSTSRLGYVCDEFIVPMRDKPQVFDGNIPWCRIEDIEGKYLNGTKSEQYVSQKTIDEMNLKVYPIGTVINSCSATIGVSAITTCPLCTNQTFIGLVAGEKISNVYLYYMMNALSEYMKFTGHGSTITYISQDKYKKIGIPLPSIYAQKFIAEYLDSKCTRIDEIIDKQQAIIEKLKEYKLSLVTEAVTKGFSDKKETKKSKVEWVDEIPVGWRNIKLKYCTYIRARLGWKGLKADEYVEEGYPLLSAFNIVNSKLDFENNINYINRDRYEESPEIMLKLGDILLVKDGAGIGKCAIVEEMPLPSTTNGSLAVITTDNKLLPKYLYYYFQSSMFQKYIDRIKDGMGVPHLFQSDLREIEVVIPTIDEQETIITLLDKRMQILDENVKKKETIIEKLQEYKKSLIYEVVTGKKEV